METVFLKILNMSITAGWLVLAVLLMRLLLKKAPKYLTVIMWALVGIRLVLPFSLESALSLIPSAETVPPEILYDRTPQLQTGIDALNNAVNPTFTQSFAPDPGASANPLQILTILAGWVWLIGIAAMVIYALISCLRIRRKLREAIPTEGNIYICDRIDTPFIFGLFRPRIYLPSAMAAEDIPFVLAHEQAHLKRRDHLWKPLGFLLLAVYWFNPLLWVAYILLCRDIEAACDEKVIRDMGEDSKKPYSNALINCSVPRRSIAACPLAFGEVGVKSRIKQVLNYKKPAFWLLLTAVIACVVLSVCFLTNPRTVNEKMQIFLDCQIAEHHQSEKSEGRACCVDYRVLGTKKQGRTTTVYLWVLYEEYSYENGQLKQKTGFHTPTVITAQKEDGNYRLVEYWTPRDGAYNPGDIKAKFPWYLWPKAMDSQRYIKRQKAACQELAERYFIENPPPEAPSLSLDIIDTPHALLDHSRGLIDAVNYDIDSDGVKELCELHHGPTSGLFTFMLAAYEHGQLEYCNIFNSNWGYLSFTEKADGSIGILREGDTQHAGTEIYDIVFADGHIQLLSAGQPLEYWGPQGIDAMFYDNFGLHMHLEWENNDTLYAVFDYQPYEYPQRVTTSSEYELYVLYNGKRWPFADYVRKIMGLDYPAQKATTELITYTITPGGLVSVPIYLGDLGIDLPAATYEISKEVEIQIADVIYTQEYTAQFAITEETADAICQTIVLSSDFGPWSMTVEDPDIRNVLTEHVRQAIKVGQLGTSSAGYYGAPYQMELYWEGRQEAMRFTVWDKDTYSVSTHKDSEGYEYFYKADISALYRYLETNYPDTFWQQYDTVTVSYAGGSTEHFDAIVDEAVNKLELSISSQIHLPVLKFDTRQALEDFCWKYVNVVTNSGWDEVPSFQSVAAQYDEAFFENNALLLVYVPCGNCTYRYDVAHVFTGRDEISIRVRETTGAEVVDEAEACWLIAVAIPKSTAEACTSFDAILGDD